jgi:hypothetical protein
MKKMSLLIAAVAAISMAGATAGSAAELPTYEAAGLPISPVQVGVLGAAQVQEQEQEQSQANALSPHQLRVLTPRPKQAAAMGRDGRATN